MASSIGSRDSVSFLLTIQATGLLTFTLVGLPPTEYASLRWTHPHALRIPPHDGHPALRRTAGWWLQVRLGLFPAFAFGRGRDRGCPLPPAQTRAGAANAHGSYLGCLAAKRTLG